MNKKVVELNVGGKIFLTTVSTLTKNGGFFAAMLKTGRDYIDEDDAGEDSSQGDGVGTLQCWSEGAVHSAVCSSESALHNGISPDTTTCQSPTKMRSGRKSAIFIDRGMRTF